MFLIVDFLNVAYRSFHAIRSLSNSKGIPTNAVYGFIQSIRKWNQELSPTHLAIILDGETPARRLEVLPQYKAHRPPMPDLLPGQLERLNQLFPMFGWAIAHDPTEEADDLGAALALAAAKEGHDVRIASNDKDFFQIVGPKIKILRSTPKETVVADEEWVVKRWGIQTSQVVDFFALIGDSVDNIPGVQGVGEKTAADLIRQFGSVEGIIASVDKIQKPRLRDSVLAHREDIVRNVNLIRLNTSLKTPALEDFRLKTPQYESLLQALSELEFKTLYANYKNESLRASTPRQGVLF
jgi:DNA polymerase-1